jgi:dihydrofolate synthase/folylpolyglutamate synthase
MRSTHTDFPPLEARLALLGAHQRDNATTAVAALHALQHVRPELAPTPAGITAGLEQVDWPGRLQVLREHPLIVLDGAHNGASAEALHRAMGDVFSCARLHLVVGLTAGKDARGVLDALAPAANAVYLTRAHHERSNPPTELEPLVRERSQADVSTWPSVAAALDAAVQGAEPEDLILVTGSLFVVGEALVWWQASRSSR